jgi:hypothetical protein
MGRKAARTTRPAATPTTYPIQASTAPNLATHSHMPGLNLATSDPQISFHIRTENSANTYQKPRPQHITQQITPLTLPANAPLLLQTLTLATPEVYTVKFSCSCLNRGTCIHYQICFRRDQLPDGLICTACRHRNTLQETISARRKCPRHTDDSGTETRHVSSQPEDFLPSEEQMQGYEGMLRTILGGMHEGALETVPGRVEQEGIAKTVPPRRPSRGMAATASQRAIPEPRREHGHAPGPTVRRASIKPQPNIRQISTEPLMLPPPTWPISSPLPAPILPPAPNQPFFQRVLNSNPHPHAQSFHPTITTPPRPPPPPISTSHANPTAPTQHILEQAHTEALAEDAERSVRAENRQMGIPNQDDSDDEGQGTLLYANLRAFETGTAYDAEATLDYFFTGNSGLG